MVNAVKVLNQLTNKYEWRTCPENQPITDPDIIAQLESCLTNPLKNTHLIEGCIESENGERISAFTIVDNAGAPLFAPKPLTDLGFVECCDA